MTHWGFVLSPRSGILVVDVVELLLVVDVAVAELLVVVDVVDVDLVDGLKTPTPGAPWGARMILPFAAGAAPQNL